MLLIIPGNYGEGNFELRAREYTSGRKIRFSHRVLSSLPFFSHIPSSFVHFFANIPSSFVHFFANVPSSFVQSA